MRLCGKPLTGGACTKKKKKNPTTMLIVIAALAVAGLATLAAALLIVGKRARRRTEEAKGGRGGREEDKAKASKEERLVFFEGCKEFAMEDLMRGSAEMLGRGAVGSTYRVAMEEGAGVVVKRVRKERVKRARGESWPDVEGGLVAEIGRWRHPNVVSLLAYYSSDDELLLVFRYVPGGSLHGLLHGNRGPGRTPLDWPQRLRLALGAARGLSFLHSASRPSLSHRHLTSSNILVDERGDALISDFALHQLLAPPGTPQCDVYGFGLVLLELLTGRTEGEGEMELAGWVQTVVREEWTAEVFDFELMRCRETEEEMVALLQVALLCLAPDPGHRPKACVVERMIEDVKARGGGRGSSLSPSVIDNTSYESSPGLSDDYTAAFTSS